MDQCHSSLSDWVLTAVNVPVDTLIRTSTNSPMQSPIHDVFFLVIYLLLSEHCTRVCYHLHC